MFETVTVGIVLNSESHSMIRYNFEKWRNGVMPVMSDGVIFFKSNGVLYMNPYVHRFGGASGTRTRLLLTSSELAQIPSGEISTMLGTKRDLLQFPATFLSARLQHRNAILARQVDIKMPVLMGTHDRLGRDSHICKLDREILFKIFEFL